MSYLLRQIQLFHAIAHRGIPPLMEKRLQIAAESPLSLQEIFTSYYVIMPTRMRSWGSFGQKSILFPLG